MTLPTQNKWLKRSHALVPALLGVVALLGSAVLFAMPGTSLVSLWQAGTYGGKKRVPVEVQIPIQAGESGRALRFYRDPLAGFENQNAASVQVSVTTRRRLGRSIADAVVRPPGPDVVGSSFVTLTSLALGRDTVIFPITWADGSRSEYRMSSDTTHEPAYVQGSGRDSDGNRLPGFHPAGGEWLDRYVGLYQFSSDRTLQEWLGVAHYISVTVTGQPSLSFVCDHVQRRLVCRYT